MGTEVVIVEYLDRILPVEDEEVSKQLERSFKKSGIKIYTNAEVKKVETKNKSVDVIIKTKNNEEILNADIVLSAVGIKTNIENIGLEDVGIAVDNDKIMVNNFYQTNLPGYYAIGDVTRGQSLAHVPLQRVYYVLKKLQDITWNLWIIEMYQVVLVPLKSHQLG